MNTTRDNSGTISKNDRKEKDTHPDIRGSATINGVAYWVDGWRKENDRGAFYSLSFKPKDAPASSPPAKAQPSRANTEDDIPF
jgi:hypothetical protein